jgi:hypothetical protein
VKTARCLKGADGGHFRFTYFVIDRLTTGLLRGDRAMMRSASLHWLKTKNPDFIGT